MKSNNNVIRILVASLLTGAMTFVGCSNEGPKPGTSAGSAAKATAISPPSTPGSDGLAVTVSTNTAAATGTPGEEETVEMVVPAEVENGDIGWATAEGVLATSAFAASWNLEALVKWLPESLSAKEGIRAEEIKALTNEVKEKASQLAYDRALRRLDGVDINAKVAQVKGAVFDAGGLAKVAKDSEIAAFYIRDEIIRFESVKLRLAGTPAAEIQKLATEAATQVLDDVAFHAYKIGQTSTTAAQEILRNPPKALADDLAIKMKELQIKIKEALQFASQGSRARTGWVAKNANRMMGARIVLCGAGLTVGLMAAKDMHDIFNGMSGVAVFKRVPKAKSITN